MADKKARKTDEESRELVMCLRIIDDTFFEEYISDLDACEELIQVILNNSKIKIKRDSLEPQKSIHIVGRRSVRVDAYVEGTENIVYNIEIQRSDSCNHVKRVRYNASAITVRNSEPGDSFDDVQNVLVIYISEFDMFGMGKTMYHVENVVRETGKAVEDGLQSIYVNTECKDGSRVSKLMEHFTETDFMDDEFPKSSQRMHIMKHDEGMVAKMCKKVQDYAEQKCSEERLNAICRMIRKNYSKLDILDLGYSEEEYEKAEEEECIRA